MGNFNRDYRTGSGGGRDFNRGGGRPREMFRTTCSNCGNECEVPFKPNGSKPVFCSNCFEKNGGGESNRFGGDRDRGPRNPRFERNNNYDRPAHFDRPQPPHHPPHHEQNQDQFASLNAKLDRIITLLTPKPVYEESAKSEVQSEEMTPAPEKKKRAPKKSAPTETVE